MDFYILTLFPEMIGQGLNTSVIGRAIEKKCLNVECVNIRDYTRDKYRKVDDYPYGGGAGMLMQAQPVYDAYRAVWDKIGRSPRVIYLTPQGRVFDQAMARELSEEKELVFLCGHYEGVDERVLEEIVTDYVSIGDYVLTGGELPAMVMIDAVSRLVPGVLNNGESAQTESFHRNLLEYPQYTRPESWRGKRVPSVLLSGDHKKIEQYRLEESVRRTRSRRPDLYHRYGRMTQAIDMLSRDRLHNMDMIEVLRRGLGGLLEVSGDGVLLRVDLSGIYMMSAVDREAGCRLLESLEDNGDIECFVAHQEFMVDIIKERFGLNHVNTCLQAVYTRKEPLPSTRKLTGRDIPIQCLGEEYEEIIQAHYHMVETPGYIRGRLLDRAVFGAFIDGKLAGFAGFHTEGSLGMLKVLDEFCGQGIATALEAWCINYMLERGNVPFGQVLEGNVASVRLQEKLSLVFAKDKVYWMVK